MAASARPCRSRRATGFTLVEVMVALLVMAILAALAFRGMDALARAKASSQAATDRTLKLNSGMSQFDYDISQVVNSHVLPQPLMWDGGTLRFARRASGGIQLVVWTVQDGRWQRWAGAPSVRTSELTDAWMRTQQWDSISGSAVTVLDGVDSFQFIVCNPNSGSSVGCSWNNAGSTQGTVEANTATAGTTTTTTGTGATTTTTTGSTTTTTTSDTTTTTGTTSATGTTAATTLAQPTGVRITLKTADGELSRERELPRW